MHSKAELDTFPGGASTGLLYTFNQSKLLPLAEILQKSIVRLFEHLITKYNTYFHLWRVLILLTFKISNTR